MGCTLLGYVSEYHYHVEMNTYQTAIGLLAHSGPPGARRLLYSQVAVHMSGRGASAAAAPAPELPILSEQLSGECQVACGQSGRCQLAAG